MEALHAAEGDEHLAGRVDRARELVAEARSDRRAQRRGSVCGRIGRIGRRPRRRLDDVWRHLDRRMAAHGEQARVALAERARRHPVDRGQSSLRSRATNTLVARTSSAVSMCSTSACAPEPTGPW